MLCRRTVVAPKQHFWTSSASYFLSKAVVQSRTLGFFPMLQDARSLMLHFVGLAVIFLFSSQAGKAQQQSTEELRHLTIEELMNTDVTTVSRIPTTTSSAPAAAYVITQEEIRRSGVRTLPDALRLAPGVHVAQIDANRWAVGIRGFADRLARAMLVLIDGRAVYSPLFAGTYWEVQDVILEDVERIEVIRGPGGTVWGSNAVNGIINIITKPASQTPGLLVEAGGGNNEDHGAAAVGMVDRLERIWRTAVMENSDHVRRHSVQVLIKVNGRRTRAVFGWTGRLRLNVVLLFKATSIPRVNSR
jgi:outer membrane cobalamin receptor